jgi:hypothetical protein
MKEKIKQCLRQHLFLIEQEDWYDADTIAEGLAKVFSSNAVLAVSLLADLRKKLIESDEIYTQLKITNAKENKKVFNAYQTGQWAIIKNILDVIGKQ